MAVQENKSFEFRLGRLGLTIFLVGVSCLVFAAFQCGVMVGKDMDAYPEKAVDGLPGFIKQKIIVKNTPPVVSAKKEEPPDVSTEKADVDLTFYDTLGGKNPKAVVPPAQLNSESQSAREPIKETVNKKSVGPVTEKAPDKEQTAVVKEKAAPKETFIVQVVSLKDEKKAQEIAKRLKDLGYHPEMDVTSSGNKKLCRVKLCGYESRNEATKIASTIEKKIRLKCLVLTLR